MKRRLSPMVALAFLLLAGGCIETPSCGFGVDFSPDGKKVAFMDAHKGEPVIAVANVDGSGYRVVDTIRSLSYPAWSPDGRGILYSNGDDLYLYNTVHRSIRRFAKGISPAGYVWSPDGRHIACFLREKAQAVWLDADSGEILLRVDLPRAPGMVIGGVSAAWLPQTWGVAYVGTGEANDVYVVEAGRVEQITHTGDVVSLWVSPDGSRLRWLRATGSTKTTMTIHEYDLPSRALSGEKIYINLSHLRGRPGYRVTGSSGLLSPSGDQLLVYVAFAQGESSPRLYFAFYVVDLRNPTSFRLLTQTQPLTSNDSGLPVLRWSPDGTLVAVQTLLGKEWWLWVGRADGSGGRTIRKAKLPKALLDL